MDGGCEAAVVDEEGREGLAAEVVAVALAEILPGLTGGEGEEGEARKEDSDCCGSFHFRIPLRFELGEGCSEAR